MTTISGLLFVVKSCHITYLYPMTEKWFESWFNTDYYHTLYGHRNEAEASAFIQRLIDHLKPPSCSTILDVACGKGRHALQLAIKGFDVTGIDLSEASIEEALEQEKENLHFYKHDMRMPFRINYYDLVFNFFTSFGYFDSHRENQQAMRAITAGLKKNGRLVIDYLNPDYTLSNLIPLENKIIDGISFHISRHADASFFYKSITIQDPSLSEELHFIEKVSRLDLNDFSRFMAECGMEISTVWGNYELEPFDPINSPRMIICAEKK